MNDSVSIYMAVFLDLTSIPVTRPTSQTWCRPRHKHSCTRTLQELKDNSDLNARSLFYYETLKIFPTIYKSKTFHSTFYHFALLRQQKTLLSFHRGFHLQRLHFTSDSIKPKQPTINILHLSYLSHRLPCSQLITCFQTHISKQLLYLSNKLFSVTTSNLNNMISQLTLTVYTTFCMPLSSTYDNNYSRPLFISAKDLLHCRSHHLHNVSNLITLNPGLSVSISNNKGLSFSIHISFPSFKFTKTSNKSNN